MNSRWISIAALLLAFAVACGAFGAHALKDRLDPYSLGVYEKAVFYHFVHALGLLAIALYAQRVGSESEQSSLAQVCLLLSLGILFFSGSLYGLALSGIKWLGAITPIGGVLFIVAWLRLALSAWKPSNP